MFFLTFGIAKLCVFFGPLLLAGQLSIEDYGLVEYTLALGSVTAIFFNTGVSTSYPYFILRRKLNSFKPYFFVHFIFVFLIFFSIGILYFFNILDKKYFFGIMTGVVMANQIFVSTKQKSHERGTTAVLVESGVFILLTVVALLIIGNYFSDLIWFYRLIFVYYLVFVFNAIKNFNELAVSFETLNRYKKVLQYGFPILFSSIAIVLFTTSGRILVEWLLGVDKVGVYAFYFRLASVVIVVYQVVNVLYFKRIYTYPFHLIDKYFSLFFVAVLAIGLFFYFILHLFEQEIFSFFSWEKQKEEHDFIRLLFVFQMVFWIGLALNENIIYRENLAKYASRILSLLVVAMILFFAVLKHFSEIDLLLLIFLHISFMFVALEVQFYILRRRLKESFKSSRLVIIILYLSLIGLNYFY